MFDPNFVIFYVSNPLVSADFYTNLLNQKPVELAPTFAMFVLKPELKFGLWSKKDVKPSTSDMGGGSEIGITVDTIDAVNTIHNQWVKQGVTIIQEPVMMDFGFTFVAADPDNHRIRVFTMNI